MADTQTEILARVRKCLWRAAATGVDGETGDDNDSLLPKSLRDDFSFDSLDFIEFTIEVEDEFEVEHVELSNAEAADVKTVQDLVELLASKVAARG